jgi:hypothetical protein
MGRTLLEGMSAWFIRLICILSCITAVMLLVVDSPLVDSERHLNHAIFEAAPLLLVGAAFLIWLFIERPSPLEWIKQAILGLAFVLWGVDMLMLPGTWATFVGAIVIAIYVLDLAWIIEGRIRQRTREKHT